MDVDRKKDIPLVSVIVPCYNVEQYIDQCLNSILDQNYKNIELIVVDDRSTDSTVEHIKAIQKSHPCIQLYHNELDHNIYGGACRNIGLEHAKGKYVYFCDSDDYILPGLIKECVQKCEQLNSEICCFRSNTLNVETNEIKPQFDINKKLNNFNQLVSYKDINVFSSFYPVVWNKLYNRMFLESIGARFQEIQICNDNSFYIKTMAMSNSISWIDKVFYVYRVGTKTSVQRKLKKWT